MFIGFMSEVQKARLTMWVYGLPPLWPRNFADIDDGLVELRAYVLSLDAFDYFYILFSSSRRIECHVVYEGLMDNRAR